MAAKDKHEESVAQRILRTYAIVLLWIVLSGVSGRGPEWGRMLHWRGLLEPQINAAVATLLRAASLGIPPAPHFWLPVRRARG